MIYETYWNESLPFLFLPYGYQPSKQLILKQKDLGPERGRYAAFSFYLLKPYQLAQAFLICLLCKNTCEMKWHIKYYIFLHSWIEKKKITRLLYPLSSYPPKTYSFPLMQAPQLPDMEVGSSPSMRCIVLQQEQRGMP